MKMRNTVEELEQDLLDEEQCWQAVLTRNALADGTFVVAVRTTGIYCRPSCPARNPYREHVTFFKLPEEASEQVFVHAGGVIPIRFINLIHKLN